MNNSLTKPLKFSFIFAFFIFISIFSFTKTASAKTSDHVLHGYAWSDNVGWVSLNCADRGGSVCTDSPYSVVIDYGTGQMSGYAWSSNVGWISFNASDVSGCPTKNNYNNSCTPTAILSSTAGNPPFPQILGWAKALSNNSGWDGYISLSCYNTNTCGTNNYSVQLPNDGTTAIGATGGSITGNAWGSTVVGWLDFTNVTVTPGSSELTLTASVNGSNVTAVSKSGDTIRLTWSTPTNTVYTGCTASNDASEPTWVNGVTPPSSSSPTAYTEYKDNVNVPNNPTTYTIACTSASKTDTASVKIDINYVWDVSLTADPSIVLSTSPNNWSDFKWVTSGNVPVGTNCVATNPNGWTAQTGNSVTERISNIAASIMRSVTCTPPAPDSPKTSSASANVLSIINYATDSCYRPSDGGPTISWTAPIAQECYISKDGNSTKVGPSGRKIFANGPGDYDISCVGGKFSVSDTLSATACVPDYTMTPLNMCNGKSGQLTDNAFQPDGPTQYKATIKVDATAESGFSSQLRYRFTMPLNWKTNSWSISGWTRIGLTDDYESPIVSPGSYNSSFDVIAPNKASANAGLASFSKKTQTFTINGDTNPSIPMARSASYTICAPDGGSSKPIFIEQ